MSKPLRSWWWSVLLRALLVIVGVNLSVLASWLTLLSPNPEAVVNQPPLGTIIRTAQYIGAGLLIVYLLQARLEGRSLAGLGLNLSWRKLAPSLVKGALSGGLLFSALFLAHWAIGAFRFDRYLWALSPDEAFWIVFAARLFFQCGVAFVEELFFRGYLLASLQRERGVITAVVGSSLLFSIVHFYANISSSWVFAPLPFINLLLLGVLLALLVLKYESLWVAIGFHYVWNVLQYHVFPVLSDGGLFVFEQVPTSSPLLTGGHFGIEGSILLTLTVSAGVVLFWRQLPVSRRVE